MTLLVIIALSLAVLAILGFVVYFLYLNATKRDQGNRAVPVQVHTLREEAAVAAEEPVEVQEETQVVEQVVEEPVAVEEQPAVVEEAPVAVEEAPVVVEEPAPVKEEPAPAPARPKPVPPRPMPTMPVIGDAEDADVAKRIAFGSKLLTFNEKVQGYFNTIYNKFISLRNINPRISTKGVSFRLGRDLVARLTIRGKTMRLHLGLNVADYPENIYFQTDMSDVKSYTEIPMMVKIRSDRGMKNAMKLIDELIEKKGIEYKTRYSDVDAIILLKGKF